MAKALTKIKVEFTTELSLNESEMRALDALIGYGINDFIKAFYEKMGEVYLKPHEAGLRSLFETIAKTVNPALGEVDQARKALTVKPK